MAQTQKTLSAIYTLLADNTTGAVSPQDVRDALESWRMSHGQIYIPAVNATSTALTQNIYAEVTGPAWTLTVGAASHNFDESGGNGRLTYTGVNPVTVHCALSYSMELASGTNSTISVTMGVNGTADAAAEQRRKIGTSSDVGAGACHLITTLTNGDYLSMFVKNNSNNNDVVVVSANLQAIGMTQ